MEWLRPVPKIFPLSKNTQCWLEKKGMPRSKKILPGQWKKKKTQYCDLKILPSGYLLHSHGKSPFLIGKPSISMGHLYHGYVSHNQTVSGEYQFDFLVSLPPKNLIFWSASTRSAREVKFGLGLRLLWPQGSLGMGVTWYPLVMTNSSPWYRWPIEIDGLPGLPIKNGDFPWLCNK